MKRAITILPFFCYAIPSMAVLAHRWKPGYLFQNGGDPIAFIWFLNWWPFALSHQLDPSTTMYVWQPTGLNLWWTTSIPTLAILGWPITATLGAVATWNILSLLAPAASTYGCFLLLTYITKDRLASLVGGLVLGFSPYLMGHMLGHLNLTFIPLVPLMVLLVLKRANGDIGRSRFVASMVTCVVLQFGISNEILATAALVGVIAYAAFYPFYRKSADMRGLAVDLSVAAAISVLIVSPALYSMYRSAGTFTEVLHDGATKFSTDLVNLLVPTEITQLGRSVFADIASRFTGNIAEQTAYLGLPLFIAVFFAASANLSKPWMAPLLIVLLASFVLSLGPVLQINGHVFDAPLPWAIINRLPVIRQALPGRLTLYAWLAISVLIGTWLASRDENGKRSLARYCAAAISITFLLPNPAKYHFSAAGNVRIFSSENVSKYFQSGDTIVVLPLPPDSSAMLWQVQSDMRFKMVGGHLSAEPTALTSSTMFAYLKGAPLPDSLVRFEDTAATFFDMVKVSSVVITPETRRPLAEALLALPWPRQTDGQSIVMKVPPSERLQYLRKNFHYLRISGDYWGGYLEPFWVGRALSVISTAEQPQTIVVDRGFPAIPSNVGAISMTITVDGKKTVYDPMPQKISFVIEPGSSVDFSFSKTWVPDDYFHNGDKRSLSVTMHIEQSGEVEPARVGHRTPAGQLED